MHISNKFKEYSNFHRILPQTMPKTTGKTVSSVKKFITNLSYAEYIPPPLPEYLVYWLVVAKAASIIGGANIHILFLASLLSFEIECFENL